MSDFSAEDLKGRSNQEILTYLRDKMNENCKQFTFRHEEDHQCKMRKPNEREKRQYMKSLIRSYHFNHPEYISSQTYYTFKGHIKRGQYEIVQNFLKKFNCFKDFPNLVERYMDSEVILERTLTVHFSEPVKYARIDIDLNKEDNHE